MTRRKYIPIGSSTASLPYMVILARYLSSPCSKFGVLNWLLKTNRFISNNNKYPPLRRAESLGVAKVLSRGVFEGSTVVLSELPRRLGCVKLLGISKPTGSFFFGYFLFVETKESTSPKAKAFDFWKFTKNLQKKSHAAFSAAAELSNVQLNRFLHKMHHGILYSSMQIKQEFFMLRACVLSGQ